MNDTPAIAAALPAQASPAAAAAAKDSDEQRDYRPGYEIVAERILEFIAEARLVPGDRMPTENDLAQQLRWSTPGSTEPSRHSSLRHRRRRGPTLVESRPLRVLDVLNQSLLEADSGRFASLVIGTARPSPGGALDVVLTGGGHPPPLVLRRGGAVAAVDVGGMLVGPLPGPEFRQAGVRLAPEELPWPHLSVISESHAVSSGPGASGPGAGSRRTSPVRRATVARGRIGP
ncbi:SpoIIE family protein phosphatase [Streptomyces sp. NPDC058960]|uniref:SpoIIE family protein phosphatase n=1 Tax=Streptomyces sp. NPDC058960 TaxID=3346679 RepID=UPI00368E5A7A